MTSIVRTENLTIASGATVSTVFSGAGYSTFGMILPATFDGTGVSFQVSNAVDGTFTPLYSAANTAVALVVAASRAYPLPAELTPFPFWRLITAAAQSTTSTVVAALGKSQ